VSQYILFVFVFSCCLHHYRDHVLLDELEGGGLVQFFSIASFLNSLRFVSSPSSFVAVENLMILSVNIL